jgi:hypothetical protein
LKQTVKLLANVIDSKELSADEATGLLQVITDYTYALDTLDKYDYQQLTVEETTEAERFHATYENAMEAIMNLKNRFGSSDLFGNEKDESFKSTINTIYQTFDGQELYPSVEEKPQCCCIWQQRIIRSAMEISESQLSYFCGLWKGTAYYIILMAQKELATMHLSPLPS